MAKRYPPAVRTAGSKEVDWNRFSVGTNRSATIPITRFNKAGAPMRTEDEAGEVLEDVARIHPALERLRQLVTSATILDLKATTEGYWASRDAEITPETTPSQ